MKRCNEASTEDEKAKHYIDILLASCEYNTFVRLMRIMKPVALQRLSKKAEAKSLGGTLSLSALSEFHDVQPHNFFPLLKGDPALNSPTKGEAVSDAKLSKNTEDFDQMAISDAKGGDDDQYVSPSKGGYGDEEADGDRPPAKDTYYDDK